MKIGVRAHDYGKREIEKMAQLLHEEGYEAAQLALPKVFAGIGAYMAEGLGEGFAREMQNVEKTIRRATASTVPEPQRPSGRISRNDNAARGVQVVQNIYANETSYAQQQREAAKQFRLIAREVMG